MEKRTPWKSPRHVEVPRDGATRGVIDVGSVTRIGCHADNQDRVATAARWVVLSDGVGGHAGGALAATLAVEEAVAVLQAAAQSLATAAEALVTAAVTRANEAVRTRRRADPAVAAMAATITVAVATDVGRDLSRWVVASVGDSPAWLATPDGCTQVTHDHTLAAELLRSGAIDAASAAGHPGRHVLVRALGPDAEAVPDTTSVRLRPGDAMVVASDGLADVLPAADICTLALGDGTAGDAARRLGAKAAGRGATDDVTVAVVRHLASCGHGSGS